MHQHRPDSEPTRFVRFGNDAEQARSQSPRTLRRPDDRARRCLRDPRHGALRAFRGSASRTGSPLKQETECHATWRVLARMHVARGSASSLRPADDTLVEGFVLRHDSVAAVPLEDAAPGGSGHARVQGGVGQQRHCHSPPCRRDRRARAGSRCSPCVDHLGQAADARRDDRHFAGHRLERRQAEALLRRRQQEHVRRSTAAAGPGPARRATRTCFATPSARAASSAARRDRGRRRPAAAAPARRARIRAKTSTTAVDPLHRAEVRDVDDDLLAPSADSSARAARGVGDAAVVLRSRGNSGSRAMSLRTRQLAIGVRLAGSPTPP